MESAQLPRKLAAILYADVAGYSRLTGKDEDATHRRLSEYLDHIAITIEHHGGRVMHYAGDAVLAMFEAVVDALSCAAQLQLDLKARNQDLPNERKVQFRIGVNLGDVIEDRGDIYGDGVNVAARLENLAEPGGICISDVVRQSVEGKLDLVFEDLGEQQVKNIDKLVRAYRVQLKPGAALPEPSARPRARRPTRHLIVATVAAVVLVIGAGVITWLAPWAPESEPSSVEAPRYKAPLAVLPFKNLSDDPEMESFADGLTEDIITDFAKYPELFVIASNTVFTYKGKSINVKDVGRELGVRYVLEGSTEKTGDTIRISAQLIDATDGKHLWAERYDGTLTDKFALRDKARWSIIANLLGGLGILTRAEQQRALDKPPESRDAYDYALLGREEMHKYTKEATVEAMRLAKKAVALDPEYADAHRLLSWVHYREAQMGWGSSDRDKSLELAYQYARKAWELDPSSYGSHWGLGTVYLKLGQHDQAMAAYERARELNPNDADLLADTAYALTLVGRAEEAIPYMQQAMQRKSNWPQWWTWTLGLAYWGAEQYQDALTTVKGIAEPVPRGYLLIASIYMRLGRLEEARAEVAKYLEAYPGRTIKDIRKFPFKDPAQTERYLDDLRKAGLPDKPLLALPDKPSIAVLPFTNMSDDPKQEYFVDGMTEDLITDLSKLSGLFVIARNSVFTYKGKPVKVGQVAEELGVRYVLEGSVRRADAQVRINAQLVDATTGGHLWAERYDGNIDNVFSLQDKITSKIVTALSVHLMEDEARARSEVRTNNPQAHVAFLKGWEHYRRDSTEHYAKAMEYFQHAIVLDPEYSQAHAAIASIYWKSYVDEFYQVFRIESVEARERAREILKRIESKPNSLAYQVASEVDLWRGKHETAISSGEKAVSLDPNSASARLALAKALIFSGRPGDALDLIDNAERLDPFGKARYEFVRGVALFGMGDYKTAVASLERARELNPDDWAADDPGETWCYPCEILASAYGHLGHQQDADTVIAYMKSYWSYVRIGRITTRWWYYKNPADTERLSEGLRKAGLPE